MPQHVNCNCCGIYIKDLTACQSWCENLNLQSCSWLDCELARKTLQKQENFKIGQNRYWQRVVRHVPLRDSLQQRVQGCCHWNDYWQPYTVVTQFTCPAFPFRLTIREDMWMAELHIALWLWIQPCALHGPSLNLSTLPCCQSHDALPCNSMLAQEGALSSTNITWWGTPESFQKDHASQWV